MKRRIRNILIALDQFIYVLITLGAGSPDETLSAAAWRTEQDGKLLGKFFRPIIDWLFSPLEDQHCYRAYRGEFNRSQLHAKYKDRS